MERKSFWQMKKFHKWLWSQFLNGLYGYGESSKKVIFSSVIIITIFAFLFLGNGIYEKPEQPEITFNVIRELSFGLKEMYFLRRLLNFPLHFFNNASPSV